MFCFRPTLFLKCERRQQILHDIPVIVFLRQIEDLLLVLKTGSCEHTTNDLPTFSPQKRNIGIRLSEPLLPIFGTKNRILKIGSCEWAFKLQYVPLHLTVLILFLHCALDIKWSTEEALTNTSLKIQFHGRRIALQ